MKKKILIINGPNLNLLGTRQPEVYGSSTFEEYLTRLKQEFADVELTYYQSNVEGELINALHNTVNDVGGVVFNAGGYTHTSVAIRDAISAIDIPVVEVHISNTAAREEFRHTSMLTGVCVGVIAGFGLNSYHLAIQALTTYLSEES